MFFCCIQHVRPFCWLWIKKTWHVVKQYMENESDPIPVLKWKKLIAKTNDEKANLLNENYLDVSNNIRYCSSQKNHYENIINNNNKRKCEKRNWCLNGTITRDEARMHLQVLTESIIKCSKDSETTTILLFKLFNECLKRGYFAKHGKLL